MQSTIVTERTPTRIQFFFDPQCPFAYQTSLWIRDMRHFREVFAPTFRARELVG